MRILINEAQLFTLNFADDQVVLAQDSSDIELMLRRLYVEYQEWGLEVSIEKTEYLVAKFDTHFEVLLNNQTYVNQVENFKYLGVVVDKQEVGKAELQYRIQNARRAIESLNAIWWDKSISIKNKKRTGQTTVESVLCYGSEIWVMKEEKRKLLAVEMDYLRKSAGVSRLQRIRNEEIRNRMIPTE